MTHHGTNDHSLTCYSYAFVKSSCRSLGNKSSSLGTLWRSMSWRLYRRPSMEIQVRGKKEYQAEKRNKGVCGSEIGWPENMSIDSMMSCWLKWWCCFWRAIVETVSNVSTVVQCQKLPCSGKQERCGLKSLKMTWTRVTILITSDSTWSNYDTTRLGL